MSYLKNIFAVLSFFVLSSCGDYISFNLPEHEEKIFVESYITENDSMVVVILQKTMDPFIETNSAVTDSCFRVDGAKVRISNENETILLDPMGKENFQYTLGKGTAYYKKTSIKEQRQYILNIDYKDHSLNAVTVFPPKTQIRYSSIKYSYSNRSHIFNIHFELSSNDNSIKHYRICLLYDITLNNKAYSIRTPYNYFNLNSSEKGIDISHVSTNIFDSYTGEENQRPKKATIVLERISDLYYSFRESVEIQKDDNDIGGPAFIEAMFLNSKNEEVGNDLDFDSTGSKSPIKINWILKLGFGLSFSL